MAHPADIAVATLAAFTYSGIFGYGTIPAKHPGLSASPEIWSARVLEIRFTSAPVWRGLLVAAVPALIWLMDGRIAPGGLQDFARWLMMLLLLAPLSPQAPRIWTYGLNDLMPVDWAASKLGALREKVSAGIVSALLAALLNWFGVQLDLGAWLPRPGLIVDVAASKASVLGNAAWYLTFAMIGYRFFAPAYFAGMGVPLAGVLPWPLRAVPGRLRYRYLAFMACGLAAAPIVLGYVAELAEHLRLSGLQLFASVLVSSLALAGSRRAAPQADNPQLE